LGRVLKQTVKDIGEQLRGIEEDMGRIRAARKVGAGEADVLREKVAGFYSSHSALLAAHGQRMEERVLRHREEGKALLLREEAQLEQGRGDLLELSRQLEELLRRRDRLEVSKLLGPLASRLDRIGGELRTTGQAIIHKLQFVPLLLPESQVPGYLSTFSVCASTSHAIIDRPVYEKVLCTIQLHLADENGVKLDVFREVPLAASMALFEGSTCRWVEVKVKLEQADSWALTFTPPCPGIAHLSVVIGGRHVRNSPYVLHVRSLSLDPHEEMANLSSKTKKCVRFNEVSM